MAKLILITGGARSGKSAFVLEKAEKISNKKLFIATCPKIDSEMTQRVCRHQKERAGRGWETLEIETDLVSIFPEKSKKMDVVLIDCMTLWINNILHQAGKKNKLVDDFQIRNL